MGRTTGLALMILLGGGCKEKARSTGDHESPATNQLSPEQQERKDVEDTLTGIKTTLAELHAHVPAASSFTADAPCPPAVLEFQKQKVLVTINTATLDRLVAGPDSNKGITLDDHLSDPDIATFRRSQTGSAEGVGLLSLPHTLHSVSKGTVNKRPFVRLFLPVEKTAPKQSGPETFTPGVIDGWLVVMDMTAHKPVCQVRARATNTPSVSYRNEHDPQQYLETDLGNNFVDEAVRVSEKIIPGGAIYAKHLSNGEIQPGWM